MNEAALLKAKAQLELVASVNAQLEKCADERKRAILIAIRTLAEAGAPSEDIFPLSDLLSDIGGRKGKKPRKSTLRCKLAAFSAAVTALKKEQTVDAVIAEIATPHGMSRKELKNFRDRLNRGLADGGSVVCYKSFLSIFRKMSKAEIMSILARVSAKWIRT
jgi:hypothetical protein